jgi:hypothetical protein
MSLSIILKQKQQNIKTTEFLVDLDEPGIICQDKKRV